MNVAGSELSTPVTDFATRHLTRIIPPDIQSLITDRRVSFHLSDKPFSDSLGEAVTTIPLFTSDKWGSKIIKPRPEIVEAFNEIHLTDFGRRLKKTIAKKIFIDLACGDPSVSKVPRILADNFGAARYIGVDKVSESAGQVFLKNQKDISIPVTYIQSDVLAFLSRLDNIQCVVFCISGLEPVHYFEAVETLKARGDISRAEAESAEVTHAYILKCMQEIQRPTKTGDAVLIGQATDGFPVQDYGFSMIKKVGKEDKGKNRYNIATLYEKK